MTETTEPTISPERTIEPPAETLETQPPAEPTPDDIGDDETPIDETAEPAINKARKDAARYRERLRESEAQTETHAATIDQLRRQIVDGMTEAAGVKPTALWAAGTELSSLLNDEGNIDPERVEQALLTARKSLGISRFTGSGDLGGYNKDRFAKSGPENWGTLLNTP
jgi:hypothetical protein